MQARQEKRFVRPLPRSRLRAPYALESSSFGARHLLPLPHFAARSTAPPASVFMAHRPLASCTIAAAVIFTAMAAASSAANALPRPRALQVVQIHHAFTHTAELTSNSSASNSSTSEPRGKCPHNAWAANVGLLVPFSIFGGVMSVAAHPVAALVTFPAWGPPAIMLGLCMHDGSTNELAFWGYWMAWTALFR